MTSPFQYPPRRHVRRHGPQGYEDYARFRPWLRDEFSFRCVYCLRRESWEMLRGSFHIDHFVPVSHDPTLAKEYNNLLYVCVSCNHAKGDELIPDPLIAFVHAVVRVAADGTITADANSEAAKIIESLGLNEPDYIQFRKLWIQIIDVARRDNDPTLYRKLMGYPDNLPDLRRKKPRSNNRLAGLDQSAFEKRKRGVLPSIY